jgi:hypothetical protein
VIFFSGHPDFHFLHYVVLRRVKEAGFGTDAYQFL